MFYVHGNICICYLSFCLVQYASSCYIKFVVYFPLVILSLQYIYIYTSWIVNALSLSLSRSHSPTVTTRDCTWYTRSSGLGTVAVEVDTRAGDSVYYHNCHSKNHS